MLENIADNEELYEEEVEINSSKGLNCSNCKYAKKENVKHLILDTIFDSNSTNDDFMYKLLIMCEKNKLNDIKGIIIGEVGSEAVKADCPCHSDYNRLESRYSESSSYIFNSTDTCQNCHRTIPSEDIQNHKSKILCSLCSKN